MLTLELISLGTDMAVSVNGTAPFVCCFLPDFYCTMHRTFQNFRGILKISENNLPWQLTKQIIFKTSSYTDN